jgi:hypothetical protein
MFWFVWGFESCFTFWKSVFITTTDNVLNPTHKVVIISLTVDLIGVERKANKVLYNMKKD